MLRLLFCIHLDWCFPKLQNCLEVLLRYRIYSSIFTVFESGSWGEGVSGNKNLLGLRTATLEPMICIRTLWSERFLHFMEQEWKMRKRKMLGVGIGVKRSSVS